ncbi:hypothetical protein [Chryseobacterium culicis]|uniref:Lipocalin-like domain-containing protein n=1 Tax=Chryseobacterium culicis TaxID=680127 RepID=A0A1H6IPW5_CHRCI|nr:hypothetical protein [Chryseobacterium culicis]MBE4950681.1 hypothetical protein [Chryseobacterium culicis]SEH48646.1 hypothetical protein SAMN05421593_0047 [Chryseobacterium culicis]
MKKPICICIFSLFAACAVKAQDRTANPLLLQTWNLDKMDTYIYTYEKKDGFEARKEGIRFQKNGKITGNLIKSTLKYDALEEPVTKNEKPDRYIGSWKKASDSTVTLVFPYNTNMTGTFVISKLTENQLKLKKVFSADIEKKLDSIRKTRNISE